MEQNLSQISRVIQLLEPLNNILGDYPIYLYIINTEHHLLWYNHHLESKIKARQQSGFIATCFKAIWGESEPCTNCPALFHKPQISRDVVKCRQDKTNEDLYIEVISLPIISDDGETKGFLKIGLDVSDSEHEIQASQEQDKLFASIIDTTVDAIFFLDNGDHILSWNTGAEEIFGYQSSEIVGRSHILLIPQELIEVGELYYIRRELESKGFIRRYETQRVDKEGRIIYVDLTRTLVRDEAGRPIGSSVIIKDITARKELEFELRRTILELSKLNELNEILHGSFRLDDILRILLIAVTSGEGLRFNRRPCPAWAPQ